MHWLSPFIFLTVIASAYMQCISENDDFNNAKYSTDLSFVNDFSMRLYQQLSPGNSRKNFFFSPYSIWSALILSYFGSAGNTQREMEQTLGVTDKISTFALWKALQNYYDQRQARTTDYTFNIANRAYFDNTLLLQPCLSSILHNEMRTANFKDTTGSAKEINQFVSDTTKGRIEQIVRSQDLVDALMVIVNAAFFKGTWKTQFKPSKTTYKDFFITPTDTAQLAMMTQKGKFRYGESAALGARILELPYTGNDISMFVLLPSEVGPAATRFSNMVNNLNGASLNDALNPANLVFSTVDVQFPKFKFTYRIEKQLEQALKTMGIVDLFDGNRANMTKFAPFEDLSIDKTIHKAFIEVNEEGTEAAAVTALISLTRSSIPRREQVINFHCNQPFIFLIYDNDTKNVLFMGAIKNPRG